MEIDLELYRVFYVTAKAGNISKAARELFISQPAVSYSIKKLEDSLGSPLFIRKPRGVELTEEAKPLYSQVEAAFRLIFTAQEEFVRATRMTDHEVRMSSTEIFTHFSPVPYLESFQATHPRTRITLSNHPTPTAVSMLKEGLLDLAFITVPAPNVDGLEVHCTMPMHDGFVVNERFRYLTEQPISLRELAQYPILILRPGLNSRRFFDQFVKSHGVHIQPHMEVENMDGLIRCARMGYGVSFVGLEMVADELADGRLFRVPLKEPIPTRAIGLCSRKHPEDQEVQQFIQGFVEYLKQSPQWNRTPAQP